MHSDWRYREGEEFRERVVRQAIMLGFEAEEYEIPWQSQPEKKQKRWMFKSPVDGIMRGYASVYSAALEYLRLAKYPEHLIGRVNDGGQVSDA